MASTRELRRAAVALAALMALSRCTAGAPTDDPDGGPGSVSAKSECGNRVVDEDELCDIAIEPGAKGACPTECISSDPCSPGVVAGADCQTACAYLDIVRTEDGDGCCPPGASAAEDADCGYCGDGIVGPAETCDPPSVCPTKNDCEQRVPCLRGTYTGSTKGCTARCELRVTVECIGGDQCCPASCDSSDDTDCSSQCGDGVVQAELGETCESSSETAACPSSCDDAIACTTDLKAGSANNCNIECVNLAVVNPVQGDGCCPSGATQVSDSDCLPVCGNAVRESGETCDPCPSSCDDDDACTLDMILGTPAACDVACSHAPVTAPAEADGCCPSGADATTDSDCGAVCGNQVLEAGEHCDGEALCASNCRWLSNLVHRYDFSGNGETAADAVGSSDATLVATQLADHGEVELVGGSSEQFVRLPADLLSPLVNVTLEVWFTWQGGATGQRIFDFGNNSNGEGNQGDPTSFFALSANCAGGAMCVDINFTSGAGDDAEDFVTSANLALIVGTRYHAAVVFEDANDRTVLYINGAPISARSDVTGHLSAIDDTNAWLGRSNANGDEFEGTIDEFRIYAKALSDSELAASFAAGASPPPL